MADSKKLLKQGIQKEVFDKLAGALADYKDKLNKKKLESKIKKTSRSIAGDIIKAVKKEREIKHAKKTNKK